MTLFVGYGITTFLSIFTFIHWCTVFSVVH
jgi:hypothetical protein